jgi:hypothetical protein
MSIPNICVNLPNICVSRSNIAYTGRMIDVELVAYRPRHTPWKPDTRRTSDATYRRKVRYRKQRNRALEPEPVNPHFEGNRLHERGEATFREIYDRIDSGD